MVLATVAWFLPLRGVPRTPWPEARFLATLGPDKSGAPCLDKDFEDSVVVFGWESSVVVF